MKKSPLLNEIQLFLTKYCQEDRKLSRQTILSYRDTLKLFILFQKEHKKLTPSKLQINSLSYETIIEFLNNLEKNRKSSVSTRNQRLCAIRSFCKYILFRHPDYADTISRCLNVPIKKKIKRTRTFLEKSEVKALLNSIDLSTKVGHRDHLMLDLFIRTGLRVSELTFLRPIDITFGKTPYVSVIGKGRKERSVPLDKPFSKKLSKWISNNFRENQMYLFSTISGTQLSTDAVQQRLKKYTKLAEKIEPSLKKKNVSPHILRHTTAMQLLNRGVDIQIIALWLGHEQIETTQIYLSESLALKRKALKKTKLDIEWVAPKYITSDISFLDDI
jgi:site-specific recombinase XerD